RMDKLNELAYQHWLVTGEKLVLSGIQRRGGGKTPCRWGSAAGGRLSLPPFAIPPEGGETGVLRPGGRHLPWGVTKLYLELNWGARPSPAPTAFEITLEATATEIREWLAAQRPEVIVATTQGRPLAEALRREAGLQTPIELIPVDLVPASKQHEL